ncbi:hypothetical protein GCM10010530_58450 [Kribbella aluminosa]
MRISSPKARQGAVPDGRAGGSANLADGPSSDRRGRPTRKCRRLAPGTGRRFGRSVHGRDSIGFDETGIEQVQLPHGVTPMSWRNRKSDAWTGMSLYRRHVAARAMISTCG